MSEHDAEDHLGHTIIMDRWGTFRFVMMMWPCMLGINFAIPYVMGFKDMAVVIGPLIGTSCGLAFTAYPLWANVMERQWHNWWRLFPHEIVFVKRDDTGTHEWIKDHFSKTKYWRTGAGNHYVCKNKQVAVAIRLLRR